MPEAIHQPTIVSEATDPLAAAAVHAEAWAGEPFLRSGEDPAEALAPGSARRRALDDATAEIEAGRKDPSPQWKARYGLMLGLERVLADPEPHTASGTALRRHQIDALAGMLTELIAASQRKEENGNGSALADADLAELDEDDEDDEENYEDDDEFDFTGQGMAIAILLFLARREGLTGEEFTEVLWENAAGGDVDEDDEELGEELAEARERWEEEYGDPARLLLDRLHTVLAITEDDDVIRLTPLALAALHEQLVEAGVDIPLLPPTAAELTGSELLAMAEGVSDAEFEAEAQAWVESRGDDPAARELLELAAEGQPGERMLAVAVVTAIGAPAGPVLRESLAVEPLRGYAKVTLLSLAGIDNLTGVSGDVPPELELGPDDLAWLATDLLALACDDEYPDPDDLAVSFREAVPVGQEVPLFDAMARSAHPDAEDVLNHLGRHHPDKQVSKAARTAAHKAASR